MDLNLKGKIAVVTGGSRGIGRRTVQRFAEEGSDVAFCGRDKESLEQAADEVRALGVKVFGQECDVTDPAASEAFIGGVVEALGGIDILVNNVGGVAGSRQAFVDTTDEEWRRTFDLNIFHAVRMTRLSVPHMQKRGGGSVVIVSSISGWKPNGSPQYGTAKAAEIFAAGELAIALAGDNIRVNTVSPGSTIWKDNSWDEFRKEHPDIFERFVTMGCPAGRLGDPDRVADVVVFVSSERGGWVNGAMIPVDGAQTWSSMLPRDAVTLRE